MLTPLSSSAPLCLTLSLFPPNFPLSHAPQHAPDNLFLPSDILKPVSSRQVFFFPELEFLTSLLISPPPSPSGFWFMFVLPSPSLAPHSTAVGDSRAGSEPQHCLPGTPCPGTGKVWGAAEHGVTRESLEFTLVSQRL